MADDPFDTVVVSLDQVTKRLTLQQFLETPLNERVRYVLFGRLEFFSKGRPVPNDVALERLRQLRQQEG